MADTQFSFFGRGRPGTFGGFGTRWVGVEAEEARVFDEGTVERVRGRTERSGEGADQSLRDGFGRLVVGLGRSPKGASTFGPLWPVKAFLWADIENFLPVPSILG